MQGKTVLVTGASSGIGKACAEQFAALGAKLIVTARRFERLKDLPNARPFRLDVRDRKQVEVFFKELKEEPIDILVNNAGLALDTEPLQSGIVDHWETMIDTNVKGLLYMTRELLPRMIERNSGHIINIGSVAGRGAYPTGNVYSATKYAVRSLSESLRLDLLGTAIRISEVAPGAVETEFSEVRWNDKKRAKEFYQDFQPLIAEDVADAVVYCATRPAHVNISELVVYPQAQAGLGAIHRNA